MTNVLLGELIGTAVLMAFGCGVVANVSLNKSKGLGGGPIVVYTGWAFAVVLGVTAGLAIGNTGDLNTAVTFYKYLMGVYGLSEALQIMAVQLIGGIIGGVLVYLAYLPHWGATEDTSTKLGVFCTIPAIRSYGANFLCECLASMFLFFTFIALGSKNVLGPTGFPAGFMTYMCGLAVWAIGCSFCGPTGYAVNPARDLGPRIAHAILPIKGKGGSDWSYAWVPILGPLSGGVLAYLLAIAVGIL